MNMPILFISSFIQELKSDIKKSINWLPDDMKRTPCVFMEAVEEGFKTGFSADGKTSSYVDHMVNALFDLRDQTAISVRENKTKSLTASIDNIKRMLEAESLDPTQLQSEIENVEKMIVDEEKILMSWKREVCYIKYHKIEDNREKRKLDQCIEEKQQVIETLRKKLTKIKVSFKLCMFRLVTSILIYV